MKLGEVVKLVNEKIDTSFLSKEEYVSTENMIPNFGGIKFATNIPLGKCTKFRDGDVLISNIRPYFKKVWFAKYNGGCSADVLVLHGSTMIEPRYLYYLIANEMFISYYNSSCKGTKMPRGNKDALLEYEIVLPTSHVQQHIVNTIGSVDDLIENLTSQNEKLFNYGSTLINHLNERCPHQKISSICNFNKGYEVGSKSYIDGSCEEGMIQYLRVGDLLSLGSTFLKPMPELQLCKFDDILIAFDGAPGRNAFGLEGAYSSGIYKVICDKKSKGLVFFELNSLLNKAIIKDHSQGTTILHAGKAIQYLECCTTKEDKISKLNAIFNLMVSNKKRIKKLNDIKSKLLEKYF